MRVRGRLRTLVAGLAAGGWFPALAAAAGEKQEKLVHVADTRGLSGFNLYFADLYNTNRLLFTLETIAITIVMGATLGFVMDKLVGMIGLDLSKRDVKE